MDDYNQNDFCTFWSVGEIETVLRAPVTALWSLFLSDLSWSILYAFNLLDNYIRNVYLNRVTSKIMIAAFIFSNLIIIIFKKTKRWEKYSLVSDS